MGKSFRKNKRDFWDDDYDMDQKKMKRDRDRRKQKKMKNALRSNNIDSLIEEGYE